MSEQEWALEAALLFLSVGALLGLLFLAMKILRSVLGFGKIAEAALDILLCLTAAVMIFLCALALDSGRARLFQLALHAVGAAAVILAFGPFVQAVSRKIRALFGRMGRCFASLRAKARTRRQAKKKLSAAKKKEKTRRVFKKSKKGGHKSKEISKKT